MKDKTKSFTPLQKGCIDGIKVVLGIFENREEASSMTIKRQLERKEKDFENKLTKGSGKYDYEILKVMRSKLDLLEAENNEGQYDYRLTELGQEFKRLARDENRFRIELGRLIYQKSRTNFYWFEDAVNEWLLPSIKEDNLIQEKSEFKKTIKQISNSASGQGIIKVLYGLGVVEEVGDRVEINTSKAREIFDVNLLQETLLSVLEEEGGEIDEESLIDSLKKRGYEESNIKEELQKLESDKKISIFGAGAGKFAKNSVRRLAE
ncbi:MAG: hypothetical protein ABEJ83_04670 [Candidatus Nanohaloarchaea archaeon]